VGSFVTEVAPRWSDMDVMGHVNQPSTVTLLEDARVALLLLEGRQCGTEMGRGIVVSRLVVDYHAPLIYTGRPVRVEISVSDLRAESFTLDYSVSSGRRETDSVVATAATVLVPYDLDTAVPRILTDGERDFLAGWRSGSSGG
jgi:acyl-CoA thioester hydrolase